MNPFKWFSGREPTSSAEFPWDRQPSAYQHIKAHVQPGQNKLLPGGEKLPDDEQVAAGSKGLRWGAGAKDGVGTHHMGGKEPDAASKLLMLVRSYLVSPTVNNKAAVYRFLVEESVVSLIDPFIEALQAQTSVDQPRLYDLAKSLATESPDREPTKFGIAVLGLYGQEQDKAIFRTIGRHEEFTLFCAVALGNADNGEQELWQLAKNVQGWGRVHIVERLAKTEDPQIKNWLLREGYKNSVMYEYLAYPCAVAGDLLTAIQQQEVDEELLSGAGEIIQALIAGGPAANMDDYQDGAAVVGHYLDLIERRASTLAHVQVVKTIREFLADAQGDWNSRSNQGWTPEKRAAMSSQCAMIMELSKWRERTLAGLKSDDEMEFYRADQLASDFKIDPWPFHWERLQKQPSAAGRWFHVMKGCNEGRIADVVSLAESSIPLGKIATGPAAELGLGPGFEAHSCLDFVLQDLGRFPGRGAFLIEAGLRSPVIRNRNVALRALSEWGRANWPATLISLLEVAREREPEIEVRRRFENLLAGRPLEEKGP